MEGNITKGIKNKVKKAELELGHGGWKLGEGQEKATLV